MKPSIVAVAGWGCGLLAAFSGDYVTMHRMIAHPVAGKFGGRPLAIGVGLLLGVAVMFICVEASRRLANAVRSEPAIAGPKKAKKQKTPADRMPPATRFIIALVALLIALGMVITGLPVGTPR